MAVAYQVRLTLDKPADLSTRGWKEIMRRAHRRELKHWHRTKLRGHFLKGAASRYGYQPRKPKYLSQPRKRGKPPLMYGGDAYNATVRGTPLIRAFPTRAKLTMNTPKYVMMRPWKSGRPNLGAEMTALTWQETLKMEANEAAYGEKEIERIRTKRTYTAG